MRAPSAKRWPLHWLYAALFRNGPRTIVTHGKRRLLRLLNRVIDVEALRPRKPKKRTYLPELLVLEKRWLPSLGITPSSVGGTVGSPLVNTTVGQLIDTNGMQTLSGYTVSIAWGDGTTTGGTLTTTGPTTAVIDGSHTYLRSGNFTDSITVTGDGGSANNGGTVFIGTPQPSGAYTSGNAPPSSETVSLTVPASRAIWRLRPTARRSRPAGATTPASPSTTTAPRSRHRPSSWRSTRRRARCRPRSACG